MQLRIFFELLSFNETIFFSVHVFINSLILRKPNLSSQHATADDNIARNFNKKEMPTFYIFTFIQSDIQFYNIYVCTLFCHWILGIPKRQIKLINKILITFQFKDSKRKLFLKIMSRKLVLQYGIWILSKTFQKNLSFILNSLDELGIC